MRKDDSRKSRRGQPGRGTRPKTTSFWRILRPTAEPAAGAEVAGPAASAGPEPADSKSAEALLKLAANTLAAVATAIWRLDSKMPAVDHDSLPRELRHMPRHIRAAADALAAGRVEIHDWTGRPYVAGMAVNVLAIQPCDDLDREVIQETIKPAVHFNGIVIQRADVIVGRPARASELGQGADDPAS